MFQQMGSGRVAHMLCLKVDESLPCVPEISANKYALNIRFTVGGSRERPRVSQNDIPFELIFCNL